MENNKQIRFPEWVELIITDLSKQGYNLVPDIPDQQNLLDLYDRKASVIEVVRQLLTNVAEDLFTRLQSPPNTCEQDLQDLKTVRGFTYLAGDLKVRINGLLTERLLNQVTTMLTAKEEIQEILDKL